MGRRVAVGAVQPSLRLLRRGAFEIELDLVVTHRELQRIAQPRAQGVVESFRPVDIVRQSANGFPHRGFGAILHDGCKRSQIMHAVIVHEAQKPFGTELIGRDEGEDVAEHFLGLAHVLAQEGEEVLVRHAGTDEHHRWDLHPLVIDLARAQAVLGAADVADMADGAHERDHAAIAKYRRDHGDVEEMAGAQPGIVGHQHIAGL